MADRTFERRRLRVYVAGPISSDVFEGVYRGFKAGRQMFLDGLAPYIPHADAYWFLGDGGGGSNWNAYLEYDLEFVSISDAVYRLDGASRGADLEVEVATKLGIPVFYESCGCDFSRGVSQPENCRGNYGQLLAFAEQLQLNGKREACL